MKLSFEVETNDAEGVLDLYRAVRLAKEDIKSNNIKVNRKKALYWVRLGILYSKLQNIINQLKEKK